MNLARAKLPAAILLLAALGGCASTPEATLERDARAKHFESNSYLAVIYIYRADWTRQGEDTVLMVNNRIIGTTLPASYFRIELWPGRHVIRGFGWDAGRLVLETEAGRVYFVALTVGGSSHFTPVPPDIGRRAILACCGLLENWAPGQRPLLR
ncbi:MAG: hypothetical protein HY323_08855 [Betaproteobacteria bacterium]|nr:hypothetical protein [Betaproteobacteria bacterium]